MHTTLYWLQHFSHNLTIKRINWQTPYTLTQAERKLILKPLQAWQLGETSEGSQLLRSTKKYAEKHNDETYYPAMQLFIKEEQKHGNNMGLYLDLIGEKRIKRNWADSLFRIIRGFNASMELWTLTVITVESAAQLFYQSMKDATGCPLLQQVCTDILIDEAHHIQFQLERFTIMYNSKSKWQRLLCIKIYSVFYFATMLLIWFTYRRLFIAGNNGFKNYCRKSTLKYNKTIGRLSYKSAPTGLTA